MFKGLKVGDTVAVQSFSTSMPYALNRVMRLTKTKVTLGSGEEFRLSDGRGVSADCLGRHITTDPKIIADAELKRAAHTKCRLAVTKLKHNSSTAKAMLTYLERHAFFRVTNENVDECENIMLKILNSLEKLGHILEEQKQPLDTTIY